MRGLRRFFSHWQNVIGLALVIFFLGVSALAPVLAPPDDPLHPYGFRLVGPARDHTPHPPSSTARLGTTPGQFDVYYTLIWGARSALEFGISVVLVAAGLGSILGAASAFFGGWVDQVILRITDAFLTFPLIAGVVAFQLILSLTIPDTVSLAGLPEGIAAEVAARSPQAGQEIVFSLALLLQRIGPLKAAFILFTWMPYTRLVHSMVLRLKEVDYVQAAAALGAGPVRLIFRHILPNSISPAVVLAARDVGGMVILQSTFTFLGLGGGSPWGALLAQNRDWIIGPGGSLLTYWWLFLPATLMVVLFGIGWNLVGDGINDWLEPGRV